MKSKQRFFIKTTILAFLALWALMVLFGLTFMYWDSVIEEGFRWLKNYLPTLSKS